MQQENQQLFEKFKRDLFYFKLCVGVHTQTINTHTHECSAHSSQKEAPDPLELLTDCCELPDVFARNPNQLSTRTVHILNC